MAPVTQPPGTVQTISDTPDYTISRTWGPNGSYVDSIAFKAGSQGLHIQNLQNALSGIPTTLRNQASAASGVTVTSGNTVAVLQTIVNDLAIFCARLADLMELWGVQP